MLSSSVPRRREEFVMSSKQVVEFAEDGRTEEGLGAAALLDDLDDTRLELLDRGNVVGEDTHVTRLGGNVDLDDVLRLEDGLVKVISMRCYNSRTTAALRGGRGKRVPRAQLSRETRICRFGVCFGTGSGD